MGGEKLEYHPAEYIPNEELLEAESLGYHAMKAYLQERVNSLRAAVFTKLRQHDALSNNSLSWAVFLFDQDVASSDLIAYPEKEILLLAMQQGYEGKIEGYEIPTIRIITNERYVNYEGDAEYLSIDFTLDGENDAQYHVDATCGKDLSNTLTPLFWVDSDGDLRCTPNMSFGLPALCPALDESSGRIVYPFGHLACPQDVMHALEVGHTIVGEILSLDPDYCSASNK